MPLSQDHQNNRIIYFIITYVSWNATVIKHRDTYAKEYDLLYNGSKSYSLCFKPKCFIFNKPVFTLNHLNIPTVNQLKYLGIIISENSYAPDLKRQMCKLYANVNMIIRKFSRCSPDVKCFFI